jgi:glutathione synthase/RimK-type ligase-like ATP-grasp enzyme
MATGSAAEKTRDHDKIREWIEERGGKPAVVKETHDRGEGAGVLRVKFDDSEEDLEPVDWDEFFETFDDKDLTFLYQNSIQGNESRFFKFIHE